MANGTAHYRIDSFFGINQSDDESNMKTSYSPDACNFNTSDGNLCVAPGLSYYDYPSNPIMSSLEDNFYLFQYFPYAEVYQSTERKPLLLSSQATGVYIRNDTNTWNNITQLPAYSAINYQLGDKNLLVMATTGVGIYDGTSVTGVANAPSVRYLALNHERVFGTGSYQSGEMDTVYWSHPMDPYDWSADPFNPDGAGGFVNIPSFDGGAIIGIATIFNEIVVFKEHSLHRIAGSSPSLYYVARIQGDVNPVSNDSIVVTGSAAYFLSRDGLCAYDGVTAYLVKENECISRVWEEYPPDRDSFMALYNNRLIMTIGGQYGRVVEYDLKRKVFIVKNPGTTKNIRSMLVYDKKLLVCEDSDRTIKEYDKQDPTLPCLKAYWEIPWMDFKKKDAVKSIDIGYVFGYGDTDANLVIEAWTDSKYKRKIVKLPSLAKVLRYRIRIRGRRVKLRLANYHDGDESLAPVLPKAISLFSGIQIVLDIEED